MRSYLGFQQRKELEGDKKYLEDQLSNPFVDKSMVRKNLRRVESDLETQAPPDLRGPELDKVVRRAKEFEENIPSQMLSQAEMRQAPPGTIGKHMAFERKFKTRILQWKNDMRTIHRDSDDPDVANLERLRPVVSQGNLDNAIIPGKDFNFASPAFKEGYDEVSWHGEDGKSFETEESMARREKIAAMRAELEALEAEDIPEEGNGDSASRLGLDEED